MASILSLSGSCAKRFGAPFRNFFRPSTFRYFHTGNHVIVAGQKGRGIVIERSNSGKTFVIQAAGKEERHPFEDLRLWKPDQARVFINGDAMPTSATTEWLAQLCKGYSEVLVWKAVGSQCNERKAKGKLARVPGLLTEKVQVVKTRSSVNNAADALLTALYGRYADTEAMNYVLSDDKQWFSELPHVFADMPTVWQTFKGLGGLSCDSDWQPNHWPSSWTTGTYVVVNTASITAGLRRKSSEIRDLAVGEKVKVTEIRRVDKDSRIRALIDAGGQRGWISLMDTEQKRIWALPAH